VSVPLVDVTTTDASCTGVRAPRSRIVPTSVIGGVGGGGGSAAARVLVELVATVGARSTKR
jgi:hypothetical protein